jgi:hypothetical protein
LIVGGKVALSVDSGGKIQFFGSSVTVDGSGVTLKGSKLSKVAPAAAVQQQLQIKRLEELKYAPAVAEFSLADQDGKPVASQPFRVEFEDGTVKKGITDASGKAKVPAPKQGTYKVSFTQLEPSAWRKK